MEPHSTAGDLEQVFVWGGEDVIARSVAAIRKGWDPHRKLVASMAQDLAHGRKCEASLETMIRQGAREPGQLSGDGLRPHVRYTQRK